MCHSFWGGFHKGWLEVGMPCIAVSILHFRCTLFRFIQGTGKHSLEDGSGREIKADAETRKKNTKNRAIVVPFYFRAQPGPSSFRASSPAAQQCRQQSKPGGRGRERSFS